MRDGVIVEDLEQLALAAQVPLQLLSDIVARRIDAYQEFYIPKRHGGGVRPIAAPAPELAKAQRWILDHILDATWHGYRRTYAYSKGSSIKACAKVHTEAKWLIKLGLKNFFGSISAERVSDIFRSRGIAGHFSSQLARICTRQAAPLHSAEGNDGGPGGYLPQGAPSSGMLANMAAGALDKDLRDCTKHFALRYTRYSDDLIFSSTHSFSRERVWKVVRQVRSKVAGHGFTLNEDKIRIRPPGSRLVVLGLLVDSESPRLRNDFKRMLEWHIYGSERFGVDQYSASRGFVSIEGYLRHVDGLFSHAIDIEPEWARPIRERWNYISDAPAGRLLTRQKLR